MKKRLLLKLSGEALKNKKEGIIDFEYLKQLCIKINNLKNKNYDIGIVVGGGNIWRGRDNTYIDPNLSDKIGILSTTMNSLILHSVFDKINAKSVILNAFEADKIVSKVTDKKIKESLDESKIIVFGGGTGDVGCSTDTAAALKSIDINANMLIKLTNVDGVYDKDPNIYNNAKKYEYLSYDEVVNQNLKVMDISAIELCKKNNIPILVVNIKELDRIDDILNGLKIGTVISN